MAMPSPEQIAYQMEHIHESRVPDILAACIVSLILAHGAVALRFVARRIKQQQYLWDDWIALASLVVTTGYISLMIAMSQMGYGHHAITIKNVPANAMGLLMAEVFYSISIMLIKTSTLFLLHRVFPSPRLTPWLWVVGILVHAYSLVLSVTVMTQCTPLPALWVPELAAHAKCIPMNVIFIITSALNAFTDLVLLALPMPFLWRLNMDKKRKWQISAIFACGALVFAISIARAPMLMNNSPVDPSWSDVNGGIWSALESGIGTLCACLPTFGVLFTSIRKKCSEKLSSYPYRLGDSESGHNIAKAGAKPAYTAFGAYGAPLDKEALASLDGKEIRAIVKDGQLYAPREIGAFGGTFFDATVTTRSDYGTTFKADGSPANFGGSATAWPMKH